MRAMKLGRAVVCSALLAAGLLTTGVCAASVAQADFCGAKEDPFSCTARLASIRGLTWLMWFDGDFRGRGGVFAGGGRWSVQLFLCAPVGPIRRGGQIVAVVGGLWPMVLHHNVIQ